MKIGYGIGELFSRKIEKITLKFSEPFARFVKLFTVVNLIVSGRAVDKHVCAPIVSVSVLVKISAVVAFYIAQNTPFGVNSVLAHRLDKVVNDVYYVFHKPFGVAERNCVYALQNVMNDAPVRLTVIQLVCKVDVAVYKFFRALIRAFKVKVFDNVLDVVIKHAFSLRMFFLCEKSVRIYIYDMLPKKLLFVNPGYDRESKHAIKNSAFRFKIYKPLCFCTHLVEFCLFLC